MISQENNDALVETLYSVPGLVDSILTCDTDNPEEWISEDDLKWAPETSFQNHPNLKSVLRIEGDL